jgi:hypothetical protein
MRIKRKTNKGMIQGWSLKNSKSKIIQPPSLKALSNKGGTHSKELLLSQYP